MKILQEETLKIKGVEFRFRFEGYYLVELLRLGQRYRVILEPMSNKILVPFHLDADNDSFIQLYSTPLYIRSQQIMLEGDFSRFFKVYAPRQYEIEVLAALDPALMNFLVQELSGFDITSTQAALKLHFKKQLSVVDVSNIVGKLLPRLEKLLKRSSSSLRGMSLTSTPDIQWLRIWRFRFSLNRMTYLLGLFSLPFWMTLMMVLVTDDFIEELTIKDIVAIISFWLVFIVAYFALKSAFIRKSFGLEAMDILYVRHDKDR